MPSPLWSCNKVLKPHFQSIFSQTNNGCSLFSLILPKLLLLDISCENIFALCIVTALTACVFSIKKCAKMSIFTQKPQKLVGGWGLHPQFPLSFRGLGAMPPDPRLFLPVPNLGCATALFSQTI